MLKHSTVLLAEDDENDVLLMQRAFSTLRLADSLQVVNNGEEAIAYLKGEGIYADRDAFPFPRLLLLDLKMPKKNGFEVLEWIRLHSILRRLIVVILTASNQTPDINRGYELGANSYLVKPSNLATLLEMFKTVQGYWLSLNQFPEVYSERMTMTA